MALQRCRGDGGVGWRWGEHGVCFVGATAMEQAMAAGAVLDPEGFAENVKGTDYIGEVVMASRDVKWDIPEGDEVIYLD